MIASTQIDEQIASLTDWRGKMYTKIRSLIHESYPEIEEEFKWGTGVFTRNGNVLAIGTFKDHVKINFFQGAAIADPDGLFNSGLEAKKTRTINVLETDTLNESALRDLILRAVQYNDKK